MMGAFIRRLGRGLGVLAIAVAAGACAPVDERPGDAEADVIADYYGTQEPFASEAVYFVMTDRFVDGDLGNNHEDQGGGAELGTFDRPIKLDGKRPANIGYLGGDFRGIVNNADYIADMGFTALWITPIVDNPDEAFTGSNRPGEGFSSDRGKTGYHGYWGVNFFVVDEHLESPGLTFADFTRTMQQGHGIKVVLDVVCNHGSPSFTMPYDQPKYGEIYGADGSLLADHQNLHPTQLDAENPLHAFYRREPDLAELSDMDHDNPEVLDYFVSAYSQWIEQGAAAFRIDTIKHMPHSFWKKFSDRIRADRPGYFMFAEAWTFDADELASYTRPENGGISVLDFPGQSIMSAVFGGREPYALLLDYLHLDSGVYQNPYDLMTFYDNHDMQRLAADQNGFIDANNWLFTSRGIPVVYYGSEIGFRAGTDQHGGNRDYFGQDNVDLARSHPVRRALSDIANVRRENVALQRGLQANLVFTGDTASFYRVYQKDGVNQTALVLLNRGETATTFRVEQWLSAGAWRDAMTGEVFVANASIPSIDATVDAHGVRVLILDAPVTNRQLKQELNRLHTNAVP